MKKALVIMGLFGAFAVATPALAQDSYKEYKHKEFETTVSKAKKIRADNLKKTEKARQDAIKAQQEKNARELKEMKRKARESKKKSSNNGTSKVTIE